MAEEPVERSPAPLSEVPELEQALSRQMGPFLEQVKQMTLEVIDEVGRRHGTPLLAQVRQTLVETIAAVVKAEVPALVQQLQPSLREGGDALRKNADNLVLELKQAVTRTVIEVFQVHLPEYSRRAGQRVLAYLLAGTLFCVGAVLGSVGIILTLERAGLPGYATYLIGAGLALGVGLAFLKLTWPWPRTVKKEKLLDKGAEGNDDEHTSACTVAGSGGPEGWPRDSRLQ